MYWLKKLFFYFTLHFYKDNNTLKQLKPKSSLFLWASKQYDFYLLIYWTEYFGNRKGWACFFLSLHFQGFLFIPFSMFFLAINQSHQRETILLKYLHQSLKFNHLQCTILLHLWFERRPQPFLAHLQNQIQLNHQNLLKDQNDNGMIGFVKFVVIDFGVVRVR